MIKVSFVYNNYAVEVTGEDASDVEMDIVEIKATLHKMPAAVRPATTDVHSSAVVGAVPSEPVKLAESVQEGKIIPVVSVKAEKTKNGSPMYKVRGGEYDLWGVALYPDTCVFRDNLDKNTFLNDVVSGLEAYVAKQDGKLRVIAVRRKLAGV